MAGLTYAGSGSFSSAPMASNAGVPSSGGGGMSLGGASAIAGAITGVIQNIWQGKIAKAQADYNASLIEGKIKWIQLQKDVEARQYERLKARFISTSISRMAGAGVMPSGSPMAVLVDSTTQINIDKAIGQSNLEQEVQYNRSAAEMYKVEGKNAVRQARVNAYSSALQSGSQYALNSKGMMDLSQGAKNAGRQ